MSFPSLLASTRTAAQDLAARAVSGSLSPREFGNQMAALLEGAHTQAVVFGRHAAGDRAPLEEDDRKLAALVVDAESEFLAGFVKDLEAGDYSEAAATARAALYAERLRGTANEATVLTLEPEAKVTWNLRGVAAHCDDCPRLAAGSPYRASKLPTVPGAGATRCVSRCRCYLSWEGGEGLRVPSEES